MYSKWKNYPLINYLVKIKNFKYEATNSELYYLIMVIANPLLKSFREPPKACVINSNHPLVNLKGKETLIDRKSRSKERAGIEGDYRI